MGGEGNGVLQLSGMTLRATWVQRALQESGAIAFSREGRVLQGRAEAGLIVGGEKTSRRAAIGLLCLRMSRFSRSWLSFLCKFDFSYSSIQAIAIIGCFLCFSYNSI